MWLTVEQDLAGLLSKQVFHTLAEVPDYVAMFQEAGFQPRESGMERGARIKVLDSLPKDLTRAPKKIQERLMQAALARAARIRQQVESKKSLRERRAKAIVLEGPDILYRLWSTKQGNLIRPWWFSKELLVLAEAGRDRQQTIAWLRDRLAVSFDFGECDRMAQLNLGLGSEIPAIAAWGLPMPQYGVKPDELFQGEKTQYYLPFVPPRRVVERW